MILFLINLSPKLFFIGTLSWNVLSLVLVAARKE
jgi:hypothetical protein